MKNKIFKSMCLLVICCGTVSAQDFTPVATNLNTEKGIEMLLESRYRAAYWALSQYYETQDNQTYCGIASAVMVLNALEIPSPYAWPGDPYSSLFTQHNFFSDDVLQKVDHKSILKRGLSIADLSLAISAWHVKTEVVYGNHLSEESLRELLKLYLVQTDRFIIANYYRPVIQGVCGGHFSPIGAYDQETDSVLILDVYRHEYTSTWVPLSKFLEALQPIDSDSKLPRGLLLVAQALA